MEKTTEKMEKKLPYIQMEEISYILQTYRNKKLSMCHCCTSLFSCNIVLKINYVIISRHEATGIENGAVCTEQWTPPSKRNLAQYMENMVKL